MEVRDAVESDAEDLASIADIPADVLRNLIHDRTVRVAIREGTDAGPHADAESAETDHLGFVSYDVKDTTVHVTQLAGSRDACERLLAEPVRFAASEGMSVEFLVPETNDRIQNAAEAAGFERRGMGPRFDGEATVRYGCDPR
ncbi:hypothetical protein ACFQJD_16160 [Haloplanus sp. GCM10025708]|uniref:hypothetical protein n=1 Tax=Haloferacaceae TaxID=1644056 RepID=UPI0036195CC1